MYKKTYFIPILLCLILNTSNAYAETSRLPGVVDKEYLDQDLERVFKKFLPVETQTAPLLEPNKSDAIITPPILRIDVEGNTLLSDETLNQLIEPYIGHSLSEQSLAGLKYDLTKAYFDEGYILVKIVTPPQDASQGVLKLIVVEGKIGEIVFHNEILSESVAEGLFSRVKVNEVFYEDTVETALNDLHSLNNIKTQLRLEPHHEFGHTSLNLHLEDAKEDINYIEYNNHGPKIISQDIISLGLQRSNSLSLGETIKGDLNYGFGNLIGGGISWSSPIPYTDLFFNASYTLNDIDIAGRFKSLNATGKSDSYRADIYRNILNTNVQKLAFLLGLEHRLHKSFLNGILESKDTISKIRGNVSYSHNWEKARAYLSLDVLKGIDLLGSTEEGSSLASRSHKSDAWIFQPTLFAQYLLTENDIISAKLVGQYSTNILLSSDLFSIGGFDSVRGFEPGQETGEAGVNATLEYKRKLYTDGKFEIAARPFFDFATVFNRLNDSATDQHLYSGGLGMDINLKHGSEFLGNTKLSLDIATSIGNYKATSQEGMYAYLQLRQEF